MFTKTLFSAAVAVVCLSSCSKSDDDDAVVVVPRDTAAIVNTAMQGSWVVTQYIDHTQDETDHFTGYLFTFGASNVLSATDGTNSYTGSWSVDNDNSQDDSPSDPVDFNISFVAPPDFEDISDDWDIVSITATKIEMIDVSGGSDNTDYLTFEKAN